MVLSLVVHAGALAALALTFGSRERRAPVPTLLWMQETDAAAPEVPDPLAFEPPEIAEVEMMIEPEPEAPREDRLDFEPCADTPSPTPLSLPALVRIPPLRRPKPKREPAPSPPRPRPAAGPVAARVTTAVPCGEGCRPPSYPPAARRLGQEGRVLLRVLVGADGAVLSADVEESSGHRLLDDAAVDAVREWTFEPAREGENAVESVVHVPFRFRLRG